MDAPQPSPSQIWGSNSSEDPRRSQPTIDIRWPLVRLLRPSPVGMEQAQCTYSDLASSPPLPRSNSNASRKKSRSGEHRRRGDIETLGASVHLRSRRDAGTCAGSEPRMLRSERTAGLRIMHPLWDCRQRPRTFPRVRSQKNSGSFHSATRRAPRDAPQKLTLRPRMDHG